MLKISQTVEKNEKSKNEQRIEIKKQSKLIKKSKQIIVIDRFGDRLHRIGLKFIACEKYNKTTQIKRNENQNR